VTPVTPLVLKLGGELLESASDRGAIADVIGRLAAERPLVVVHGGGRAIDVELARRAIAPKKIDGLRVTDADTLEVVVSVLGGSANTALVAACVARGVAAVGLTGVDAGTSPSTRSAAHRTASGKMVDLGFVGNPTTVNAALVDALLAHRFVPVVASIGFDSGSAEPQLLNVNADVMACRLAAALRDGELVIAGTTPGVLGADGAPVPLLDEEGIDAALASGTATAGMIAKLSACRQALADGVVNIRIIDGRALASGEALSQVPGTLLVAGAGRLESAS
jgi:acetylglutamate kinase